MAWVGKHVRAACILAFRERVSLTSSPGALFKHSKFSNYSFKKSTITISIASNTQLFIKTYHLKCLKSVPGTLVNIFLRENILRKK